MDECNTRASMGFGTNLDPNLIHVRKFRWTLKASNLPEYWMASAYFNWKKHTIECSAYEVWTPPKNIEVVRWLENFDEYAQNGETLTFTTWDGCGRALYRYKFSGLTLLEDTSDFDYASSDASCRQFTIHFQRKEHEIIASVQEPYQQQVIETQKKEVEVEAVETEKTPIHFLNCTTWLPGKIVSLLRSPNRGKCRSPKNTDQEQ